MCYVVAILRIKCVIKVPNPRNRVLELSYRDKISHKVSKPRNWILKTHIAWNLTSRSVVMLFGCLPIYSVYPLWDLQDLTIRRVVCYQNRPLIDRHLPVDEHKNWSKKEPIKRVLPVPKCQGFARKTNLRYTTQGFLFCFRWQSGILDCIPQPRAQFWAIHKIESTRELQ